VKRVRPSIENIILIGPGIGRLIPADIKQVYASAEVEPPYETAGRKGFISFGKNKATKKIKGGVTRKLATFVIPIEKIKKHKEYHIRVKVNSAKQVAGSAGRSTSFNFDVSKIADLIAE